MFLLFLTRDLFPVSPSSCQRTHFYLVFFKYTQYLGVSELQSYGKRKHRNIQFTSWGNSWCVFRRCKDCNRRKEQLWHFMCLVMNLAVAVLNHFPLHFWKVWLGRRRASCFVWYSACEKCTWKQKKGKITTAYLDSLVKAAHLELLYASFCSVFCSSKIKFTEEPKWTQDYSGFNEMVMENGKRSWVFSWLMLFRRTKTRGKAASLYLNIAYVSFAKENKWNKQTVKSEDVFIWEVIFFPNGDLHLSSQLTMPSMSID